LRKEDEVTHLVQPYRFDPPQLFREVVVVGCGGTGAPLARAISRIIYDLQRRRQHVPVLRFVDPDRVEAKNVGRQAYTWAEAQNGVFKAETLAKRFSYALGLDIEFFNEPFDAEKHVSYGSLVVGAVDNHLARTKLSRTNCTVIDAGNAKNCGQVAIGNAAEWRRVVPHESTRSYPYLPTPYLLFPALLEPEPPTPEPVPAVSCGELLESGDQSLMINDQMACIAATYVYRLLTHTPLTTFVTYVDCDTLSMKSVPLTPEHLDQYRLGM
jgi:PRTRC genetic system ThiF family protein